MSEYARRIYEPGECCRHDCLARKCETCAAEDELEWTRAQLAASEARSERLAAECRAWRVLIDCVNEPNPKDRPAMASVRAARRAVEIAREVLQEVVA